MPAAALTRVAACLSRFVLLTGLLTGQSHAADTAASTGNSLVVLMYHHVDEDTPPITSVTPATFRRHLDYLESAGFRIWPLSRALQYLVTDQPVPDKTVVITFDDAYRSVYDHAFPELEKRGWPFAVFVTSRYIDEGYKEFMSWQQLQTLARAGAEIGNHSHTHPHLVQRDWPQRREWKQAVIHEIDHAQQRIAKHISKPLPVFAYPYGETDSELQFILKKMGYYGLGQHSGAIGAYSNPYALPRYPVATGYDDLESFAIKVNSKALPVRSTDPADGVLTDGRKTTRPPILKIRLADGDYDPERIACYASGQGRIRSHWARDENRQLVVQARQPLSAGRTKYNCTAPSLSKKGVYYWFSFLWMKPLENGHWYRD